VHAGWAQFAKVAFAHLLAVASPGPDFAMVVRQSVAHGRRAGVWTSLGIASALLIHIAAALLGIALILRTYPAAFTAAKFVGAGYLAWIGVRALLSRPQAELPAVPAGSSAALGRPGTPSAGAAWTTGFLTNVTNPKVVLFIAALFTTLIDPATPRLVEAGYGLWMAAVNMGWFTLVAYVFTRERVRRAFLRGGVWIDRAMGILFLAFAAALAVATIR
jgi:threonine/homoserine/homoserine lactone efflux protein